MKVGLQPGSLDFLSPAGSPPVWTAIEYGPELVAVATPADARGLASHPPSEGHVVWTHIEGALDAATLAQIGQALGLDALVLEDIATVEQRSRLQDFGRYFFTVLQTLTVTDDLHVEQRQISAVLLPRRLVTFATEPLPVVEDLRARVRTGIGGLRTRGADFLLYLLVDAVVDDYFRVLDQLRSGIEDLEDELFAGGSSAVAYEIHRARRSLGVCRRAAWPLREAISQVRTRDVALLGDDHEGYWRDVADHLGLVTDFIETAGDHTTGLLDLQQSMLNTRLNEVMKVLTIVSAIFIPLSFLASIYGMNFRHMPELEWPWGYPLVIGAMAAIAISMLVVFRRRGWF